MILKSDKEIIIKTIKFILKYSKNEEALNNNIK